MPDNYDEGGDPAAFGVETGDSNPQPVQVPMVWHPSMENEYNRLQGALVGAQSDLAMGNIDTNTYNQLATGLSGHIGALDQARQKDRQSKLAASVQDATMQTAAQHAIEDQNLKRRAGSAGDHVGYIEHGDRRWAVRYGHDGKSEVLKPDDAVTDQLDYLPWLQGANVGETGSGGSEGEIVAPGAAGASGGASGGEPKPFTQTINVGGNVTQAEFTPAYGGGWSGGESKLVSSPHLDSWKNGRFSKQGDFEETSAQKLVGDAFRRGQLPSKELMERAAADSDAQKGGLPMDMGLTQHEMQQAWDRANNSVRLPKGPLRDKIVSQNYDHMLMKQMSMKQMAIKSYMDNKEKAKRQQESIKAKDALAQQKAEADQEKRQEKLVGENDKKLNDVVKQKRSAMTSAGRQFESAYAKELDPAKQQAMKDSFVSKHPWHGDEQATEDEAYSQAVAHMKKVSPTFKQTHGHLYEPSKTPTGQVPSSEAKPGSPVAFNKGGSVIDRLKEKTEGEVKGQEVKKEEPKPEEKPAPVTANPKGSTVGERVSENVGNAWKWNPVTRAYELASDLYSRAKSGETKKKASVR